MKIFNISPSAYHYKNHNATAQKFYVHKNPFYNKLSFGNLNNDYFENAEVTFHNLKENDIQNCLEHISNNAQANNIEYPKERINLFHTILEKITSSPEKGTAIVAKDKDGNIVSSCMIDYFQDYRTGETKNGEIMGVYTAPNFQKKGLSSHMLKELLQKAKEENCENIFLYTRTPAAKRLYEKLGFKQLLPEEYNGRVIMHLNINA